MASRLAPTVDGWRRRLTPHSKIQKTKSTPSISMRGTVQTGNSRKNDPLSSSPPDSRNQAFRRDMNSRTRSTNKNSRSLNNLSSRSNESSTSDKEIIRKTIENTTMFRDSYTMLHDLQIHGELCDIEIKTSKRSIPCHKLVMCCASRYFKVMFTSRMKDSKSTVVDLSELDPCAVEDLVTYAYTAQVTVNHENAQPVLHAATYLQMDTVAQGCSQFMKQQLHPSNVINMRKMAEQNGRSDLIELADSYMIENFTMLIECDDFCTISPQNLSDVISSENLNVESEMQVYEAVLKWVKSDIENRKQALPPLLAKVKLPTLPASYLTQVVEAEELIRSDMECRDHLDEAKSYRLSLAGLTPLQRPYDKMVPRKSCSGVLFCIGGRGASGDPFKCIECFDFRNDRWFQIADMNTRRRHVGVESADGKLYSIGGHDGNEHLNSCEMFDPVTNRWKYIAPMKTFRRGLAVTSLGGALYAIGGLDDSACFDTMERYDPTADHWSNVCSMNVARGGVGVAVLKNCIYAIGGNDGNSSLSTCERYDPILNKWLMIAPMNKRRAGAGVAVLHGLLYAIGGFDDNAPLDSAEVYDPDSNEWQYVTSMRSPRGGVGVAQLGGHLFAVGGHDGANYLNSVEAYNPIQDSWNPIAAVVQCRAGAGVTSSDILINQIIPKTPFPVTNSKPPFFPAHTLS